MPTLGRGGQTLPNRYVRDARPAARDRMFLEETLVLTDSPKTGAIQLPEPATRGADLFSPEGLRISQDFCAMVGVKKAILSVPVRKPDRQTFFRVHPDPEYRVAVGILEVKEDREIFLVQPHLVPELAGEVSVRMLFTTINRLGDISLWPVKLPSPDGRQDEWSRSALEAAKLAEKRWVRLAANMSLGAYDVFEATGNLPDPDWPDMTFPNLLKTAFRERFIQSLDHPAIKRLRGAI